MKWLALFEIGLLLAVVAVVAQTGDSTGDSTGTGTGGSSSGGGTGGSSSGGGTGGSSSGGSSSGGSSSGGSSSGGSSSSSGSASKSGSASGSASKSGSASGSASSPSSSSSASHSSSSSASHTSASASSSSASHTSASASSSSSHTSTSTSTGSWTCKACSDMCCNIPANGNYYLTTFCQSGDTEGLSCGGTCQTGGVYFTADRQRYGCQRNLLICHGTACVKAVTKDAGPASWVEHDANMPIIDASPAVCQKLFGSSSCGWSDKNLIHASLTSDNDPRPLGPFNVTREELEDIITKGERLLAKIQHYGKDVPLLD